MKPKTTKKKSADTPGQRTRTSGQLHAVERAQLQEKAFYLSVEGKTCRQIGEILGINKTTASEYIRAEEALRAEELGAQREAEKARRIARLQHLSKLAEESRSIPGSGAFGACGKFEEMINRILGVDAPTKIDLGLETLFSAFDNDEQGS